MKDELEELIISECPNLYADAGKSEMETCMHWGLAVGDGWEPLIREVSIKLEKLIIELPEEERSKYKAAQVKEKFGTLRFYMNSETEEMSEAIREAEHKSCVTCERCGKEGRTRNDRSWVKTLCDECVAEDEEYKRLVSEMIPCPFCKGNSGSIELIHFHHWVCECNTCDARGPVAASKEEAVKLYNKRD